MCHTLKKHRANQRQLDSTTQTIDMLLVLDRNTGPTCSTEHDTGTAASPHCILFARPLTTPSCSHVPTKSQDIHATESVPHPVQNNLYHLNWAVETQLWVTRNPTCPIGSHGLLIVRATSNSMSWSALGCCVTFCLAQHIVWSRQSFLFNRYMMPYHAIAVSCPIKLHHGNCSQGAAMITR